MVNPLRNTKISYTNISATTAAFTLPSGLYGVLAKATWGGGNVALQRRAADNSTYVTCLTAFTADGYATVSLPAGTYRFAVTTATAVYLELAAIAEA